MKSVIGRIQHQGNIKPQQRPKCPTRPSWSSRWEDLMQTEACRTVHLYLRKSWNPLEIPPHKSHMLLSSATKWQSQKWDNPIEHGDYTDFPWKNPEIQTSFTHLLRDAPAVLNKQLKAGKIGYLRSLWLTHLNNHVFTSAVISLRTITMHHFRKVPSSHHL